MCNKNKLGHFYILWYIIFNLVCAPGILLLVIIWASLKVLNILLGENVVFKKTRTLIGINSEAK